MGVATELALHVERLAGFGLQILYALVGVVDVCNDFEQQNARYYKGNDEQKSEKCHPKIKPFELPDKFFEQYFVHIYIVPPEVATSLPERLLLQLAKVILPSWKFKRKELFRGTVN